MTLSLDQFIDDYQNSFCFITLNEKQCNDVSSEDFSSLSIFSLMLDPCILRILYQISRNFTFTPTGCRNQEESKVIK